MRTITICLITLITLAGASFAELTGDAEVNLGWTLMNDRSGSISGEDGDYPTYATRVRLVTPLSTNGLALQTDIFGEWNQLTGSKDDSARGALGAGTHLYYEYSTNGLVGIFASAALIDMQGAPSSWAYIAGLESQRYFENTTLYGQAFYLNSKDDDDSLREAMGLRGVSRYFINDSLKLEGEISLAKGEMDSDSDDAEILGWGLSAEQQLGDDSPFSLFAKYSGSRVDNSQEGDCIESHAFFVGVRWLFGEPETLKAADRSGARLDLPAYTRWMGVTAGPME